MSHQSEPDFDDSDELIEEIRKVRHRISERFGHDPYRMAAYYMERQKEHEDRLIRAPESEVTGKSST
jgi:hypothetical protein